MIRSCFYCGSHVDSEERPRTALHLIFPHPQSHRHTIDFWVCPGEICRKGLEADVKSGLSRLNRMASSTSAQTCEADSPTLR